MLSKTKVKLLDDPPIINSLHLPKMFYRFSWLGLNMRVNGEVKSIIEIQLVTAWASVIHSLVAAQLRMLLVVRRGPPVLGQMAHTASYLLPSTTTNIKISQYQLGHPVLNVFMNLHPTCPWEDVDFLESKAL